MDTFGYNKLTKKIDIYFNFLGYNKIKETKEYVVYKCPCSDIIVPKIQVSPFLIFMLFCQDEKVVDKFESNDYRRSFVLNAFMDYVKKHIESNKLK